MRRAKRQCGESGAGQSQLHRRSSSGWCPTGQRRAARQQARQVSMPDTEFRGVGCVMRFAQTTDPPCGTQGGRPRHVSLQAPAMTECRQWRLCVIPSGPGRPAMALRSSPRTIASIQRQSQGPALLSAKKLGATWRAGCGTPFADAGKSLCHRAPSVWAKRHSDCLEFGQSGGSGKPHRHKATLAVLRQVCWRRPSALAPDDPR